MPIQLGDTRTWKGGIFVETVHKKKDIDKMTEAEIKDYLEKRKTDARAEKIRSFCAKAIELKANVEAILAFGEEDKDFALTNVAVTDLDAVFAELDEIRRKLYK